MNPDAVSAWAEDYRSAWETADSEAVAGLFAGDPVTLARALLPDFDDDASCRSLREYWNSTEGTHEPPDGWGE